MGWLLHWLAVHTGTVNEPGPYYGFFSGAGSDLGEVAIVGGMLAIYKRHNCAVARCWRIGRHKVPGTEHVCCRKHTPGGSPTHAHILMLHRVHKAKEARRDDHDVRLHPGLPDPP